MQVIFILSPGDSLILIKNLYEIGKWLITKGGNGVVFYLPEIKTLNFLPQDLIDKRWLEKKLQPEDLPEADIIISTNRELLLQLNNLARGELIYLKQELNEVEPFPERIRVVDFNDLPLAVPEKFFKPAERVRDKFIITGDNLDSKTIEILFDVLEKVVSTTCQGEIVILDATEEFEVNTYLKYSYKESKDISLLRLLEESFFLINVEKDKYPILPYWAIAAGVNTITINMSGQEREGPLVLSQLDPLELTLTMIKLYKLGKFRENTQKTAQQLARRYKIDETGRIWTRFLGETLEAPPDKEDSFTRSLNKTKNGDELVDLVIVNYNTLDYLKKNIESIKKHTELPYQLIVVDNGSNDGSLKYLRKMTDILLIENEENLGYAQACNQGILAGNGEYIILLNSDIEVTAGWLNPLIETAREEDTAVVGPKLINKEGEIVGAGVKVLDEKGSPRGWKIKDGPDIYSKKEEVLSVGGACYLIKRELLPILGLFDEGYFFYYEEFDYSLRAREKGYKVIYNPESTIYHHHEGSLKAGDVPGRTIRNNYFSNSRKRFLHKWSDIMAGGEKRRESNKIIIGGLIPWDFRQQRPQHLVKNLADLGYEILYLNPVCDYKPSRKVENNIHLYSPPGYGTVLFNLKNNNEITLGRGINKELRELGFENSVLILNAPYWTPLLKYWEYSLLVYDCIDNYTEFEDLAKNEEYITEAEKQLLDLADLVFTPSMGLYEEKMEVNKNTYLLPNGVDINHFNYQYQPVEKPADILEYNKIIGYFGAIAPWFDTELIASLARDLPETGIILIGEVSTDITKLRDLANVKLLGEKPYGILPDYLAYFDLAVIPFKKNPLTEMTNPVKLYEYLAGGKPVLTTNLPEVEQFKSVVEIANNKEEFIGLAEDILTGVESEEEKKSRFDFVKSETWGNRAQRLRELLHLAYYELFVPGNEIDNTLDEQSVKESVEEEVLFKEPGWLNRLKGWFSNE